MCTKAIRLFQFVSIFRQAFWNSLLMLFFLLFVLKLIDDALDRCGFLLTVILPGVFSKIISVSLFFHNKIAQVHLCVLVLNRRKTCISVRIWWMPTFLPEQLGLSVFFLTLQSSCSPLLPRDVTHKFKVLSRIASFWPSWCVCLPVLNWFSKSQ